jgi:hypothetical protein
MFFESPLMEGSFECCGMMMPIEFIIRTKLSVLVGWTEKGRERV